MVIAWPLLRRQLEIPMTHWSMGEQIRYRLSVCLKISPPRLKCFRKWLSDNGAPGYKSTRKPKSVYGTSKREFFYSQKSMPRLVIGPNKSKDGGGNNVRLEDCFIGILEIVDDAKARLTLDRCYVGKLSLYNKALEDLGIKDSALLSISAPISLDPSENPFRGRVSIERTYIPRRVQEIHDPSGREGAVHEFRNVRTLLTAKNDALAAGVFHGAELTLERQGDTGPTKLASALYELMSDYGNSTIRPLIALVSILSAMIWTVLYFDVVKPADIDALAGWQLTLCGTDLEARALRGLTYSLQTIFNPISLLTPKPLLVTGNWLWSLLLIPLGLAGTLAVALFVLALRRRFKLE